VQVPTGLGACVALVLELLPGKNVEQMIKEGDYLSEILVRRLAKQMTSALSYLKEQGIVHGDIKPANILTDDQTNFKLGDFGLASEVGKKYIARQGTPYYMTPEILTQPKPPYVSAYEMDIWALGVTLFQAFHGALPWITKSNLPDLVKEVKLGKLHREGLADEPEDFAEFVNGCLKVDPNERFTPFDCLESTFLTNPKRKSPEGMSEEVRFASDLTEFGEGTRDEFYYWLARKYATLPGLPLTRFNELYDSLTVKLSE
jgi:serine/threonine protein kinase